MVLFRSYFILRSLLKNTIYMVPRASRVCRMYGLDTNYVYAIKCLLLDKPISLLVYTYLISFFLLGIALEISERPFLEHNYNYNIDVSDYGNNIWLVIITMSTVGYGDIYPKSLLGRLITTLIGLWGIFLSSIMVVVLSNTL